MGKSVFLDTVGLVALLNKDDEYHGQASDVFSDFGRKQIEVVTTDLILCEVGNVLARTKLRDEVLWLVEQLHQDEFSKVFYVDKELLDGAVDLYRKRSDKAWGLVDCVSFSLMQKLGIHDAFTADRHFEQAGYVRLLK